MSVRGSSPGPLRQFTPANSNHHSHPAQTRALLRYLRWRNANARHPDVLAAERKERARIRSARASAGADAPSPPQPDQPGELWEHQVASVRCSQGCDQGDH